MHIYTYELEIKNCNSPLEVFPFSSKVFFLYSLGAWKHLTISNHSSWHSYKYFFLSIPYLSFQKLKLSQFCVS